jgi:hypothetical protein
MGKSLKIDKNEAQLILRKLEYNWKKTSKHPIIDKLLEFINENAEEGEDVKLFTEGAKKANEFLKGKIKKKK